MTLLTYMAKNAFGNPRRTALTGLSLAVSLALILVLQTILLEITKPTGLDESIPRIVVRHRTSLTMQLPRPYEAKLRRLPGIVAIVPFNWFGGVWKDDRFENFFPRFGTEPEKYFQVFVENSPRDPAMLAAWKATKNGCFVGDKLAARHGFKVGDDLIIKGDIYPVDLELKVVGILVGPKCEELLFRLDYLDDLLGETTRAGTYFVLADSGPRVDVLLPEMEAMFRNSDAEVKAETEQSFALSFVEMLGNIKLFINALVTVVVIAVLMIAASTMSLAIRERTREVATLKAVGFTGGHVMFLIVGEGMVVSMVGGGLGLLLAWFVLPVPKYFISIGAGILTLAVIGLPLLLVSVLLPETGRGWYRRGLARLRAAIEAYGPGLSVFAGVMVTLLLLQAMPSQDWVAFSGGMIQSMTVRPETMYLGVAITLIVGLGSSLWPAWSASRLSVLDGLRNQE